MIRKKSRIKIQNQNPESESSFRQLRQISEGKKSAVNERILVCGRIRILEQSPHSYVCAKQSPESRLRLQTLDPDLGSRSTFRAESESRLRVQSLDHVGCLVTENQNQNPESRLWTQSQENKADSRVKTQNPDSRCYIEESVYKTRLADSGRAESEF